jgi:exonuclease 3'-5' domain-containing protein 1
LSQVGLVKLVSLCFESCSVVKFKVSLVDLNEKRGRCHEHIQVLKMLLESEMVEKIVHDCHMDCDALYHLHGMDVKKVHDTSCFHEALTGSEDINLNDGLFYNGIQENLTHNKDAYKHNPSLWATRPMMSMMIQWASADVNKLLLVVSKQVGFVKHVHGSIRLYLP